jgi:hypothetical protein
MTVNRLLRDPGALFADGAALDRLAAGQEARTSDGLLQLLATWRSELAEAAARLSLDAPAQPRPSSDQAGR